MYTVVVLFYVLMIKRKEEKNLINFIFLLKLLQYIYSAACLKVGHAQTLQRILKELISLDTDFLFRMHFGSTVVYNFFPFNFLGVKNNTMEPDFLNAFAQSTAFNQLPFENDIVQGMCFMNQD